MKDLTSRQRQILDFIIVFTSKKSCPPTVRETADHFSISIKAVQDHFTALRKKEYLAPAEGRSRSLRLLVGNDIIEKTNTCEIPLLGDVAAGKPLLCDENCTGYVSVSKDMVKDGYDYFALHVRGDSMIEAGILNGDVAIIRKQENAYDREIVVALIEDSVTLKRFYKESTRIRLEPENSNYKPIYCQDIRILGVLANIIRTY